MNGFRTLFMKGLDRECQGIASVNHIIDKNSNLASLKERSERGSHKHGIFQITLSFTSPTKISICSGADRDLPFRFLWMIANSTPSLSAIAVTLTMNRHQRDTPIVEQDGRERTV